MSGIYDVSRAQLMGGDLDWRTADLILVAWSGVPTFDPVQQTIAHIKGLGFAEAGVSLSVLAKTVDVTGTAQSGPVVVPGIVSGTNVTWMTMCRRNPSTHDDSQLVLFIDDIDGMPFVANGLDVVVQPDWSQSRGWWRA